MSASSKHKYSKTLAFPDTYYELIINLLQSVELFCAYDTALLKALYLATFEATKKWTMSIWNWGQVYGELSIMCEGRLPE